MKEKIAFIGFFVFFLTIFYLKPAMAVSIVGETGDFLKIGVGGDFNGDGKRDMAVCTHYHNESAALSCVSYDPYDGIGPGEDPIPVIVYIARIRNRSPGFIIAGFACVPDNTRIGDCHT